jgi:hypothetical protein
MFTVFKYFWRGLRNISVIEIALLIFDICIVIAAPRYLFDYYLWTIALICDLGLLIAHGAWLCRSRRARPVSESFP